MIGQRVVGMTKRSVANRKRLKWTRICRYKAHMAGRVGMKRANKEFKKAALAKDWSRIRELNGWNLPCPKAIWLKVPLKKCKHCEKQTPKNWCCVACWNQDFEETEELESSEAYVRAFPDTSEPDDDDG